ncbi:MAG: tetratricopeptide repeat protein [Acetobacteraceae bacterium]
MANSGDLVGAFNFGVCLAEGLGVERNERAALAWMRRAADGVVNAQYWYGRMMVEGRGVEADAVAGRSWIARAAEPGLAEAEVALAEMFVNGQGGPRQHQEALRLCQKATRRGHVGAMFAAGAPLARMRRRAGPLRGKQLSRPVAASALTRPDAPAGEAPAGEANLAHRFHETSHFQPSTLPHHHPSRSHCQQRERALRAAHSWLPLPRSGQLLTLRRSPRHENIHSWQIAAAKSP